MALLTVGIIFLLPFVWSISTSLKPMSDLFQVTPNLIPSEIRWQNYSDVLDKVPFLRFYANTIIVTVARVIGQVFLASMAAFAFSRLRFPGRDVLFFLLLAGLMVPEQVLIIPNYALMRQFGWLDSYQGLIVPLLFSAFGTFLHPPVLPLDPGRLSGGGDDRGRQPLPDLLADLPAAGAAGAGRLRLPGHALVVERVPLGADHDQPHRHAGPLGRHRPLPGAVLLEQRASCWPPRTWRPSRC